MDKAKRDRYERARIGLDAASAACRRAVRALGWKPGEVWKNISHDIRDQEQKQRSAGLNSWEITD